MTRCWMAMLLVAPLLLAGGCKSDAQGEKAAMQYQAGDFSGAVRTISHNAKKTDQDYVLNNERLGSAALADYDLVTAEKAFLRAYEVVNSSGVNDGGRALSAAVVGEDQKIWKGEPFERAMLNYYLGLIYYMRQDYNNSRAAFENALFKLRDYSEDDKQKHYDQIESNFVLAYFMLGKCYQHLHREDEARKMFDLAAHIRPDLGAVAQGLSQDQSNLLLVIDWGRGPEKVENGDHAFVGFGPTPREAGPVPTPQPIVDGQYQPMLIPPLPLIDLLALAQDRRWQDIDTIRAIKSVLGKGLVGVGAFEALHGSGITGHRTNGNDLAVGAGLIVAGLLVDASSQADLRQWEMLPRSVFLCPMHIAPGTHDVTVSFPDGQRQTWQGLVVPAEGEATYYVRMLPYAPNLHVWPPPIIARQAAPPVSEASGVTTATLAP